MFKKFLCLVAVLLAVVCVMASCDNQSGDTVTTDPTADAETTDQAEETEAIIQGSDGLQYDLDDSGEGYSVSIGSCTDTEIVIANYYNGKPVTTIADEGFSMCKSLTNVQIPSTVTNIGCRAFFCCYELTSITIPEGVTSIGELTFYQCVSLSSVTIPGSVTSIGRGAFSCSGLNSINIPDSVTSIDQDAFFRCMSLLSVTIPASVTSIGAGAFTKAALTSITVAEGNPAYHSDGNCLIETASKTLVTALENCAIPDDITGIGECAFWGHEMTSITIPDGVTHIDKKAFWNCDELTSIIIPASVKIIGIEAFDECEQLKDVYYTGNQIKWTKMEVDQGNEYFRNAKIHYNYTTDQPD